MRCLTVQTAFLGDIILTVPLLSLLRGAAGVEASAVVTTPVGAELLEDQAVVDDVIVYDKRGCDRGLGGLLRAGGAARRWRPDCVLLPHRSVRSAILARLSGAPRLVGFDESGGRWLLTDVVPYHRRPHEVERIAELGVAIGLPAPASPVPFRLRVPPAAADSVERRLREQGTPGGRAVLVAPGSRWPTKRWPAERFARAAGTLAERLGGPVVLVGGPEDREVCARAREAVGEGAIDLCGELALSEWMALIARGAVLLANDSAAGHVAAGVGTPVVTVFGPTVPEQGFAPYSSAARVASADLDCRPCGRHGGLRCRRGDLACMDAVTAGDVAATALELVREQRRRRVQEGP